MARGDAVESAGEEERLWAGTDGAAWQEENFEKWDRFWGERVGGEGHW